MPGERPRRAPPPNMTRDLQPCQVASGLGPSSQHPLEHHRPASRPTQGTRGTGSEARAGEPPEAQPRQAEEVEPEGPLLRTQALSSPPGKGGSPQAPMGRSPAQAHAWLAGGTDGSPPQLYSLCIPSSRARPSRDEPPEGPQHEAPRAPEAEAPRGRRAGAHRRPGLQRPEAPPAPEELSSQRCFQEALSSFTSTNYTSPSATPGPPALRAPQSRGASPHRPASHPEPQASGVDPWPPAAEINFPGANFGVPSAEPEPFPEGSRPGSPQGGSFQYPFPAQAPPGAGTKSFPADSAGPSRATGALVYAFHQPLGTWPEAAMGTGPTYPLTARPDPQPLPCYPSQPGGLEAPGDLGGGLSPLGAAHSAPTPFSESLHKSLTKVLPEGSPSAHDGLGSPRGPLNPLPQRHFPGQGYGANGVGTSPGPLDTELPAPGPPPPRLPQLWDPTAAPYPTPTLGPPATARTTFFEGQRLCLPQSPPLPWPPVLPTPGPSPHRMGVLSRLPFPGGGPEWQGGSQGVLGAAGKMPGPGEMLAAVRSSPGQPGGSSGLFTYSGLKEPGPQPLFFGGTQPQATPRGAPSLPPARVVGASPSESPLPSPATNTAGSSTCSSLSPPSSSPANPSSEDGQLPGPLGPLAFFHTPTHSQETGSPFPFPTDGLGAEGAFQGLEEAGRAGLRGFPREPPPYSAQHFSLSSASLDQLDVLLTCRQCDRNYSSLAAFLEHRQFCTLRLTRTKEGPPQPATPPATPKAPTAHTGLLNPGQPVPFLLAGDVQTDSKDDPLRTSFLPSLAAASFPLPAPDLDMEDDAKLDSLITEALNGMEYQSDSPEIDSSFIDVFADEEPSGPRGPSAGQPPNARLGATLENSVQPLLPAKAATPESRGTCPGNRACPARNRPKTRSRGLAPTEAGAASLVGQQRRGKRFKLFRKELDVANGAKGPGRAICLRPRRKAHGVERPPPQDPRAQTPTGHAAPGHRVPRATSLPTETRSSKRLRLPPGKDCKKRRARGGSWSKELIHKIVQQKNRRYRRQAQHGPLPAGRPLPSTQDCASESEEDDGPRQRGPSFRGRPRQCRRWLRGEKRKEEDLTRGPRKVVRQGAREDRGSPTPGEPHSLSQSLAPGEALVERGPEPADHSPAAPEDPLRVPTHTDTPEDKHPSWGFPQEAKKPETAREFCPNTTKLREVSRASGACVGESPNPPAPEPPQSGQTNSSRPRPSGSSTSMPPSRSSPVPGAGGLLGASGYIEAPPCSPARRECLVPTADATGATYPEPSILVFENPNLGCDPARSNRDSMAVPSSSRGPQPDSSSHSESFLRARDLAGDFPEELGQPLAVDTSPASGSLQDSVHILEPKPPKSPPYAVDTDPGKTQSPLTLDSTSLFAGLPEDGFDPPLYDSLSANRGTHVPLACADPVLKKPLVDALYPSFLLLEEVSPMLPSQFPGPSEGKAFSKHCPQEGTVPPSPPPVPGKGSECGTAFISSLCEDELEIKRLVTELESQLRRKEGTQGAPGELDGAAQAGRMGPGPEPASPQPTLQAASPHGDMLLATDLTGLRGSSPQPEGALGSPQGDWPCPATDLPGEAAPPPGTHEDTVSGAPFSPMGGCLSLQAVQKAGITRTERASKIPLGGFLPDLYKQGGPLLDTGSLAKCSPNRELPIPETNESAGTQSKDIALLLPCEQRGGRSPEPSEAEGPCRGSPALEAFGSPVAHLASELVFQGDGDAPLDATPPPGANRSNVSKGHPGDRAQGPEGTGLLHPTAAGQGFKDSKLAPKGASPLPILQCSEAWCHPMPSPAWVPSANPSRRPRDPAPSSLHPLQALGARAESKDNVQDWQEPPPGAQSCQPRDPSDLGADSVKGGSPESIDMTVVPAEAGHQLGPETDGHLGSPSQTEKPKGQGKASWLQSVNWRSPGGPDTQVSTQPETPLVRLARGRVELEGGRAALGLQKQTQPSPSPTSPDGDSAVPAVTVAHTQKGPEDRIPEMASPGLAPQLLSNGESPAHPRRALATPVPLPTSPATPAPCSLKRLPQEDPPSMPSVVTGAQGEPRGPLPEPPSYRDPPSPQHQPAHAAWAPLGGASYVQAPTNAGAEGPPSLMTCHCGPEKTQLRHPVLRASHPEDPLSHQAVLINVPVPARPGEDSPKGSTVRTIEDYRKEGLRGSPAHTSPPPSGGTISPRVTIKAADLSSIPTEDDTEAVGGLGAPDPHCRGGPCHTSPGRTSKGPSSDPLSSIPCPGHREDHSVTAVPMDSTTLEAPGLDPHTCLEVEAGTGSEGQGDPGTPGARHSGVTKAPRAARSLTTTCPPTGLPLARATSPSSTASDLRSDSPKSPIGVPHQTPRKDPLSPQDPKRRPRGFKSKSKPMEKEPWKGQAPAGPPVTCELCSASFRSGAGLSRHKARKHRPHGEATSQPSPKAPATHRPLQPTAQVCRAPGKKNRKVPAKERPSHSPVGPGHAAGPPPIQGSAASGDTLGPETLKAARQGPGIRGAPLGRQSHPPGLMEQGEGATALASKPRRADGLEADKPRPRLAEKREVQRRGGVPRSSPSSSGGMSNKKAGKPRVRQLQEERGAPASTDVISDRRCSHPSTAGGHPPATLSSHLSPEGDPGADVGPGVLEDAADAGPGAVCAEQTPTHRSLQEWKIGGTSLGEQPVGRKGALARRFVGPRESRMLGISEEPLPAGSHPAEDSRGPEGGSEDGTGEGAPDPPEMSGSEVGSTVSSCLHGPLDDPEAQSGAQEPAGTTAKVPSPGLGDPPSLFDDEVSFSQLFPLDGRLARKKNPRVYGKRCKRPKCPPPIEPHSEVGGSAPPFSAHLPTDLSDSGSLCLSHEDLWDDEIPGLPESFLLDRLLSSKAPDLDPWGPGLTLWALEPSREAGSAEDVPPHHAEDQDEWSEAIPQLHMVPAAWRGLGLWPPNNETSSSLGDTSPEPPNLEREPDDPELPRNASLPPLHAKDFEVLSAPLEMQDLCFLGPCEDVMGLPSPNDLDFKATGNLQGPRSKGTEEVARKGRTQGRAQPAKGGRASYKCRVCFQRFHSLGELDLHKLAHSPSPPPTCYMCVERRFTSRELLREHLQEKHAQGKAGPWACGMCLKEVADVWMYNQHLREHATRFARKGQARRALGGLPGCSEGDSAITRFLNSIMEQGPEPHRDRHSAGRVSASPREASEQDGEAGKETPRARAKPKVCTTTASSQDGALTPPSIPATCSSPSAQTSSSATHSGSTKASPSPSPDPWSHSEPLLQAIPVHEDCKDPSRDCHHCGKRFPKPFKLQRHLAVHSPQRVYLCPRCPRVYPEHHELRAHLGGAHGVEEERELPHTPLYACELCANVMHVIRRSFVCSSCNYTFAKKEQFDRHMDKHLRSGQQPFALRGVRRPGAPGRKAPAVMGTLPSKRRRVAVPGSLPGPPSPCSPALSEGSLPALPQLCPEAAPGTTQGRPQTQERPVDPMGHPISGDDPPSDSQGLLPPSLSPSPAALAEVRGGHKLDTALERPEDKASPGSPGPRKQQAPLEGKRAPRLFSGKHRSPGARGRLALGDPSLLQKEKPVSTCHMVSEGRSGGPSHKGSATKPGACRSSSKDKSAGSTPSKAPKLPAQPRKPMAMKSPAPRELARGSEDKLKSTTPKAKLRPSSQGNGGPHSSTKTGGGSQPQPASGQLQSETASIPGKPSCPGRSLTPDQSPPQAQAKGCTKGTRGAGNQGPQGCPGPREKRESSEKRRKSQAPGPTGRENVGSLGKAPSVPDKPPRAPRKQATPSRVLPAKPRPSTQSGKARPQPAEQRKGEPGHAPKKGSVAQARPLLRPPKRGRADHGAEPTEPRDCRTAESQSDLLSQLFGQRLTSFKIPLKKDLSE